MIRLATPADAQEIADLYHDIRQDSVPTKHGPSAIAGWLRDHVLTRGTSSVYLKDDQIVAWVDVREGWLDQLYCRRGFTGKGIGLELLNHAKAVSPDRLMAYTFQVNDGARRFYAREGFIEAELSDGADNEERQPDVRLVWTPSL
ncbi:MAG: GNAT family N-acetyltransferase [Fimbriimonadaceae bacterium]